MKIPAVQPLTPAQSRAARHHLGLSQTEVIKQSDLSGHKLKNFETGRFIPDTAFLKQLSDFYSALGVDLSDEGLGEPVTNPSVDLKPGATMIRTVQRPCFFVSDTVSTELLDQCLERMHDNDERIAALLGTSLKSGMLGGHHDATVAEHQELFGAMAENYLIFRLLQGNPIVQPVDSAARPTTHAHLLGQFYAKSPVAASADGAKVADAAAEEKVE
jgi:transcriptional regulator with XRE-family HTH domain